MGFFLEFLFGGLSLVILLVLYFRHKFDYWKRKGIPYLDPSFPFGNLKGCILRHETMGVSIRRIYDRLKESGHKYAGFYMFAKPIFTPIDPDVIKTVLLKDFSNFPDRDIYHNEKSDPLSAHMFAIRGQTWRNLRQKLTPTFTPGKLKMMFQILTDCAQQLEDVTNDTSRRNDVIDVKEISARFNTDIIASAAFGLESNSLKNPDSEFRKYGRKFFQLGFLDGAKRSLQFLYPELLEIVNARVTDPELSKFFMDIIRQTVEYREANNVERNDMVNLLLKLKNNKSVDDAGNEVEGITIDQLAAQCFAFFVGGFETSATVMTFAMYELSRNRDVQDRLRDEINTVLKKHDGKITFEAIAEMAYLDKVIYETLRLYPPIPILNRKSKEDWRIPGTDKTVDKRTMVIVSVLGVHMDPEYYPDPERFDPERFTEENKAKRHPYAFLGFGEGPRYCIGMKFGLMQTKVGLVVFLKDHRYTLHPKTITPIVYDVNDIVLSHKHGIYLQPKRIKT